MDFFKNIDTFINIIYSLNGDIFGELVRDYNIRYKLLNINLDNFNFNNINIVFSNNIIIKYFIRIVSLYFEIYKNTTQNDNKIDSYYLIYNYNNDNNINVKIIKLNIFSFTLSNYLKSKNLEKLTYDLDCNQFFINSNSLYLVSNKNLHTFHLDQLYFNNYTSQFNRILNKKFCLKKKNFDINTYLNNIDQAYDLIHQDWIMDDFSSTNTFKTCILLKWCNKNNNNFRYNFTIKEFEKFKDNNSCSICSCNFTDNCIVVNTICNHNFHWYCNNDFGLKYWIQNHNNSCPICRLTSFI
jgi:hypothetical protein